MNARQLTLNTRVHAALHIAAAIFSTAVAAAEFSPNSAEWPTGDGWVFQAAPQEASHATRDWKVPASPLTLDPITPKTIVLAPMELKFNITLTMRRTERARRHCDMRFRYPAGSPSHNACPPQKAGPAQRGE